MKASKVFFISVLVSLGVSFYSWFVVLAPVAKFNELKAQIKGYVTSGSNKYFPSNLEISIKKGIATINQPSPFCLKIDEKENMGIIYDENAVSDIRAFSKDGQYKNLCTPVALVGKDFVMYPDDKSIKVTKLSSDLNFSLTKPKLDKYIETYYPLAQKLLTSGYYIIPIVIWFFVLSWIYTFSLWLALVLFGLGKAFKSLGSPDYGLSYKTSILSYTIYTLLNIFLSKVVSLPFSGTIICSLISIILIKNHIIQSQSLSQQGSGRTP